MFGDEEFRGNCPCRVVFPPKIPRTNTSTKCRDQGSGKGSESDGRGIGWDHEGDLHRADMAHVPDRARRRRPGVAGEGGVDTHICLDKQLPCLYPFPQRSQRSSAAARFPSVFICAPSLARRLRPLGMGLPSAASEVVGDALRAPGSSWPALFILRDRYEVKPDGDPTEPDSSPLRPPRLRRCAAMGSDADSPPSFSEAATAAAALAAAVVTLFRRVTR